MSAIAYITDSKMLDYIRLNTRNCMNFWRPSTMTSFSDFKEGDLVFFLSKDKAYVKDKEKGIVGFGKVEKIITNSPHTMWEKFTTDNGYSTYEEFKEAIIKVNKNHELPSKISSFYLKNVVFLQAPIYLSECGMNISNNIESYTYIKPEDVVIKILEYAKNNVDLWSSPEMLADRIDDEQLEYAIKLAHNEIGDYSIEENKLKIAKKTMKEVLLANPMCKPISDSNLDLCLVNERNVLIVLYNNKDIDSRLLIGQAELYKRNIGKYYPNAYKLYFKTSNGDKDLDYILNKY